MNINNQQRTGSSTFMLIAGIACVGIAVVTGLDLFTPAATGAIEPIESIATPKLVTKKIEDIRPGDMVVSKDDVTGEVTRNKVVRLFRNTSDHLRILEFRYSDNDTATHRIETTNEHPFWVSSVGWVTAQNLQPGDSVDTADSQSAVLTASRLESHPEGIPVYNFEVAHAHSYFVRQPNSRGPPLWVHDDCNPIRTGQGPFGYPSGNTADELVTVHRATNNAYEIEIFRESGAVLSDAARPAYLSARRGGASVSEALDAGIRAAEGAHARQLSFWGSLDDYVQAHGAFGHDLTEIGERSLISFTTDPSVLPKFGDTVLTFQVPRSNLLPQTLPTSNESELLVIGILRR